MSDREVVITGLGLTAPLGKNVGENWSNVTSMRTGIIHDPDDDLPNFLQYMGKVSEYELPRDIHPKLMGQMKFLNRGALLGFCAASEAVSHSRDSIQNTVPGRRALYVASGDHTKIGYEFMYPAIKDSMDKNWTSVDYPTLNESALNKVNPFFLLESLNNNLFSFLSAFIEFMGPNTSLASLSPCGGNALELAYRSIKQNRADVALAVGYGNWITEIPLYELEGLGILSKCKNGVQSFKPFDRKRDGFIPGEGGAAILLESAETAKSGENNILGKIREFANCSEVSSDQTFTVPEEVSKQSILNVLEEASSTIDELAFIIPHGSGTQKGDRSELASLMSIFNKEQADVPLCGLKPYTGHMGAASDIAEIIFGINALKEKTIPVTLNFRETEKKFSDLRISDAPRTCDKNRFLSVSYGIGGQSSSVIVEVY